MAGYLVGWNLTGEEPDFPPKRFDNSAEAKRWLRDELRWQALDEPDPRLADELWHWAQQLELGFYQTFEYRFTIGSFDYWIKQDPPRQQNSYGSFYGGF